MHLCAEDTSLSFRLVENYKRAILRLYGAIIQFRLL